MRGYMYEIVECFPAPECELGVKVLHVYDRLEDAEIVMAALESVNYNYTCYGIMLRPVWDVEKKVQELCDHSGSTAWLATNGESGFHCPKCGKSTRTDPWI